MTAKTFQFILAWVYAAGLANVVYFALNQAYEIRMHAITEYGRIIHEFDPYFNYRATEYLWANGWYKFRTWFDYMSWYPLGRPVGTTIYPGMQCTSCLIKKFLLPTWSINDVCCFVPVWFGVLATIATSLLAYECSVGLYRDEDTTNKKKGKEGKTARSPQRFSTIVNDIPLVGHLHRALVVPQVERGFHELQKAGLSTLGLRYTGTSSELSTPALEAFVITALIMSILPAHLMRSVGGGYDNESIAVFAMTITFYTWCRSLRGTEPNYVWAVMAGLCYFYMVAAWGGYVFVINLIGVHASILVLLGRYSTKLHRSYSIFYLIGTALATTVPVVGWVPLKSLEQMGPLLAFVAFQMIEFCEIIKRRRKLDWKGAWKLRIQVFLAVAILAGIVAYGLVQSGYFGPISSRVRGLFVKHTRTGNPLVDSVAEHQPANAGAYEHYLDILTSIAPVGFAIVALFYFHDASSFLIVYGVAAYYFSNKMVRLILLTAPIASVLSGIALSHLWAWGVSTVLDQRPALWEFLEDEEVTEKKKKTKDEKDDDAIEEFTKPQPENIVSRIVRGLIFFYFASTLQRPAKSYFEKSHEMASQLSHPSIITKGYNRQTNEEVVIDDYREAYWWCRDNTPEDARIMAWWDYGYQIAGIANRTTIADGNTWNHEHIGLLGRTLTSPLKDGHRIARHLADYILLWTGGGGDDLAKSPHMRRIANSVYRFLCPNDPTCQSFGMHGYGAPTKSMEESLLYRLHSHNLAEGVEADKNRFKLVFESQRGKVRVFRVLSVSKESKAWCADPANRICDAPGSWFCRGQYPPALQKILAEKKDFAQLEDFNRGTGSDKEYTKQYMEYLNNPEKVAQEGGGGDGGMPELPAKKKKIRKLSQEDIAMMNDPEAWDDNMITTAMWETISQGDFPAFKEMIRENPEIAHVRSKDGRGPIWWAHEYGRGNFVKLMTKLGVSEQLKDLTGVTPLDLSTVATKKS